MSTKLKGQNLRVFLEGQVISAALQCQLRINANVRDTSTKDTTGDWVENEVTDLSWEVTADSAVWTGDGPGNSTKDLLEYRGATVQVSLCVTDGEYNAEIEDCLLDGLAIVTGISINARNRENSTCNIILTGKSLLSFPQWLADKNDYLLTADGYLLTVRKD